LETIYVAVSPQWLNYQNYGAPSILNLRCKIMNCMHYAYCTTLMLDYS